MCGGCFLPHKWRHFHSPRELASDLGRGGGDAYRKDGRPRCSERTLEQLDKKG